MSSSAAASRGRGRPPKVSSRAPAVSSRSRSVAPMRRSPSRFVPSNMYGLMNATPGMTGFGGRSVSGQYQRTKSTLKKAKIFSKKITTKREAIDFFDASKNFDKMLPLPNSLGIANTLNFKKTITINTSNIANANQYVILQFTPTQTFAMSYLMLQTPAVAPLTVYTFDDLNANPPTNIRNSRLTATLLNLTNINNIAGSISMLSIPNGLEWEFSTSTVATEVSVQFQNEIKTMVDSNNRSKQFTANMFTGNNQNNKFSLTPSSMAKLEEWQIYQDITATAAGQKAGILLGANNFSHSTIIFRFDHISTTLINTYNLVVNGQYGARYPSNSIISSLAKSQGPPNRQAVEAAAAAVQGEAHHGSLVGSSIG